VGEKKDRAREGPGEFTGRLHVWETREPVRRPDPKIRASRPDALYLGGKTASRHCLIAISAMQKIAKAAKNNSKWVKFFRMVDGM